MTADSPTNLEARIRASYPDARIVHVSQDEYPALESALSKKGYVLAAAPTTVSAVGGIGASSRSDCDGDSAGDSGDTSFRVALDVVDDFSYGNRSDAAIVFVIIGAVVVVVWTFYAVKYVYDLVTGVGSCGHWSEFMFSGSAISSDSQEHARFAGMRYLTGFRDEGIDVGLAAEAGYADLLLTEVDPLRLKGAYWLLGPVLRWRVTTATNPSYFQMEFLAGSTEHSEVGLLAQAKVGLSLGLSGGFRWGINFGAMNINLHEGDGVISDTSRYYYLLGMEMGYRF